MLHATRLSEPFPKGTSGIEATSIARNDAAVALAHTEEHSAGSADPITDRSNRVIALADQLLHDVDDAEFDTILDALVHTTPDPITQARAILALIGNPAIAQGHMRRRPDLFPTPTPAQAAAVTQA